MVDWSQTFKNEYDYARGWLENEQSYAKDWQPLIPLP